VSHSKNNEEIMEALLEHDRVTLHALVGDMIPTSYEHDIPGADEELIFNSILISVENCLASVKKELRALDRMTRSLFKESYVLLDQKDRRNAIDQFFNSFESESTIATLVLQCYYRDDRIMRSLGMEARPPFPLGHTVEESDWSLLDRVKKMGKKYRLT